MDAEKWEKSNAKKLLDCFLEIEESQYPEIFKERLKYRHDTVRKFIIEFGADHVTVNNFTNMMQFSSSITIDVFDSEKWLNGSININLGSEPHELWATRERRMILSDGKHQKYGDLVEERFDFQNWVWKLPEGLRSEQ